MSVINPGGTDPNSKEPYHDWGNENAPFVPEYRDRPPLISPNEWLQISSGLQTSNLNNGRWNMRRYAPWYNDKADYNTSAKSYYDYLSRLNYLLDQYRDVINQLLRREIIYGETTTIKGFQNGNWETEDDITLTAIVKISKLLHHFNDHSDKGGYDYSNAIWDDGTGIFAKDFTPEINDVWDEIHSIWNKINNWIIPNINNIYDILSGNWKAYSTADFSVHMKNTFKRTNGDLGGNGVFIYTQDVYSGYNVRIQVATRNGSIGCDDLSSIKLGHGNHDIAASYIFGIDFTGGVLKGLDFTKLKNIQQVGNAIWNIKGSGNKWSAYESVEPNVGGDDFVVALESYANGDNTLPSGTMETCNINLSFYVPKK